MFGHKIYKNEGCCKTRYDIQKKDMCHNDIQRINEKRNAQQK